MSLKKTNFIESHCEKLLLGSFVLLLAIILVWHFAFLRTEVKVGNKTEDIAQLRKSLDEKADGLKKKMNSDQDSWSFDIPDAKVVSGIIDFEKAKIQDVSSPKPFDRNQPFFGELLRGSDLKPEQQYHEPVFQAAKMGGNKLTTDAFDAKAIDAEERAIIAKESPEFTARFLAAEFTDVTWVSPWGVIDLKELRAELAKDDATHNPPIYQVPPPWSNDSLYIVDVIFERQEKGPNEKWGKPTTVATVPGKVILTNKKELNRESVFATLESYENQLQVLQPDLLPLVNSNFQAPSFLNETAENPLVSIEAARQQALKLLNQKRENLAKIKNDLTSAGGPLSPPPPGSSGNGDSGGQGKGKGGGFGMGGGGSMKKGDSGTGVDGQTQATKEKRISLTKKYAQAEKAFQKAEAEFAAKYPDPAKNPVDKKVAEPEKRFKDLSEVLVWTHDFNVREGATYQYRITSKIYNPFFVRDSQLLPTQTHLSKGIAVNSATSEWGAEVSIPLTTSFFLTRGSSQEGIGGRRITVDYFRYFNGELRSTSEDLFVGDPVGGVVESRNGAVDFSTPWYLVDIFDDAGSAQNAGIFALFEQRTSTGEVLHEIRSLADKDSEIYKDFKKQLPAAAPKKIAVQSPKA